MENTVKYYLHKILRDAIEAIDESLCRLHHYFCALFNLPDIMTLAQTLDQYSLFYPEMTSPTDYARAFLSQKLGPEEMDALADKTDLDEYGRDLMKRDNIIDTEYGFICTTGLGMGSPLMAEKEQTLPEQPVGGMKY